MISSCPGWISTRPAASELAVPMIFPRNRLKNGEFQAGEASHTTPRGPDCGCRRGWPGAEVALPLLEDVGARLRTTRQESQFLNSRCYPFASTNASGQNPIRGIATCTDSASPPPVSLKEWPFDLPGASHALFRGRR